VKNDEAGVELEVQGAACADFVRLLKDTAPPLSRIDAIEVEARSPREGEAAFTIEHSERHGSASSAIGPDATVCRACVEEMLDPAGRRYRYPFLSCTHCGPRFTITHSLPYDRPQTSMAAFPMCADCRAEYEAPLDRRFHAQPIACPACGPRLSAPIEQVAADLKAGRVVALKGLGGFHLVCDARQEAPVRALRTRKHREAKPFAVMVLNVASARRVAHVDDAAQVLLESVSRPVVLLEKRTSPGPQEKRTSPVTLSGVEGPTSSTASLPFDRLRVNAGSRSEQASSSGAPFDSAHRVDWNSMLRGKDGSQPQSRKTAPSDRTCSGFPINAGKGARSFDQPSQGERERFGHAHELHPT
jgi:hydrogenase maturation protein HypF